MCLKPLIIAAIYVMVFMGTAIQAKADVVTFTNLGVLQPSYTEAGMTVTAVTGGFLFGSNSGVGGSRNLALLLMNSISFTFAGVPFDAQTIEINLFPDNGTGFPPNTAIFTAFNGGVEVGSVTLTRAPGDPPPPLIFTFGAEFQGITSLVLRVPVTAGHIQIDNFTFQSAQTAVPEPCTMILFVTGLAGVGAGVRKRLARQNKNP